MAINQYPRSPLGIGKTVTHSAGTFTVDCESATDFYLDFNDSYFTAVDYKTITAVNTSTADFGAATSGTLTLPASMQEGDLVIVAVGSDTGTGITISSTGWTEAASGTSNNHARLIWYKVMGSTPDTSFVITAGLATASTAVAIALRNGEWESISSDTNGTTGTSGMPDAPSVTTTTDKSMVIAVGFLDDDSITATAPTNYSNLVYQEAVALTGFTTMLATRIITTAGAENPGAFGGGGTDDRSAYSIIIKPLVDTATATIDITNIPNQIKEISIFGEIPALATPLNYLNLSWDTDIVQIQALPNKGVENNSFFYKFFTYNGEIFTSKEISIPIQKTDIIKSTSTWTASSDVTKIEILLCGGGGGGESDVGGSGSVIYDVLDVTPNTDYTITIGAGGTGASTGATDGSTSSFGSLLSVAGGGNGSGGLPGGLGGYGGNAAGSILFTTGKDGYGDGGMPNISENAPANSGRGGPESSNGGSGIAIIKYWSSL